MGGCEDIYCWPPRRRGPVSVLDVPPRHPSLGVVHYAETIEDIIRWLKESPAPCVLVATHLFGPDLIIQCHRLLFMGQDKSFLTCNKNELDAHTTARAINSLNPKKWFVEEVCLPDLFLSLLTPCCRLLNADKCSSTPSKNLLYFILSQVIRLLLISSWAHNQLRTLFLNLAKFPLQPFHWIHSEPSLFYLVRSEMFCSPWSMLFHSSGGEI